MATTPTLASPPMTRAISASLKRIGLIILLLAIIHLDGQQSTVRCQDFEDLNNNNNNNNNKYAANNNGGGANQQAAFQPSRQSSSTSSTSNSPFQGASNLRQSFQRPVLSNRFAQQQLSAQASTISNTVVSGQQQQQQTLPTTTSQQQQATSQPAPSNIEQIMKNALARTNRFEQAGGDAAESRQDQNSEPIQSRSGAQFQSSSSSSSSRTTPAASANTASAQDSSEGQTNTQAADEQDKQTTAAAQAGTTNGHDTVYSDQRFANLFARRGNQKKTKFTPTEQVRAKPTLPSFIKSPPDPKQFSASAVDSQDRPITPASANLISVRLQQQQSNQNRQSVSSQKKPVAAITSNTAANANNKRLNSQKQQTTAASVSPKASSGSRANGSQANANVTNRPASNNPFNKPQQNSNDPANVIAMARRRLLANNANNQQQQQRPVAN